MEEKRSYLENGRSVFLSVRPEGSIPEKYIIRSFVGEGSSSVCYEAVRERDGQTGKLKEFYPMKSAANPGRCPLLRRLDNGQLVLDEKDTSDFEAMSREYLDTYRLLNEVMADNPYNQVLKNYIQNGEILYGCSGEETKRATVYVWSPGLAGQGFDRYLEEVRGAPERKADYRLHEILQTTVTVADCVKALHTAGLMHLDIKPSNFLVLYDSEYGMNANSISMFDINTLYSVKSGVLPAAGTPGYQAPEVLKGKVDNRSDIYSIGAMLFNAIVISEDIPEGVYCDAYFEEIGRLVRHSRLIAASQAGADVGLMTKLTNILKKCLARSPKNRYESCSALLEDLKSAEIRAKQYAVSPKLIGPNKKLAIVEKNKRGSADPVIVMQKLLYEHPLYEALPEDAKAIHVLVAGSGPYRQKFIDLCLQAGQMKGVSLHIQAVSEAPGEDRESYLQSRPAVSEFVNVDGSMEGKEEKAYGTLNFISLSEAADLEEETELCESDTEKNKKLISALVDQAAVQERPYNYIFVALGSDRLNYSAAKFFAEAVRGWEPKNPCPVCYISQRGKRLTKKDQAARLYPVCINEPITSENVDLKLEQLAFHTHLSWNSSLNIDVNEELQKFREDKYNYVSSLDYALSIKYKLRSVGIKAEDNLEAARLFSAEILEHQNADPQIDPKASEAKKKFNTLAALEHRRWVLSKITDGWTAPRDDKGRLKLEECVINRSLRNPDLLTHLCILFGTEATPLSGPEYQKDGRRKWDDPNIDPGLDELDRMSVELHQCCRLYAEKFKKTNPLQSQDLEALWHLISEEDEEVIRAYRQFRFCLKNILNGSEGYTRQYHYYEGMLRDSLERTSVEIKNQAEERLPLIFRAFYPVIEANLYRDYKANDQVLVEKLPFILTCRLRPCIAMAFEDGKYQNGRNEAAFADVGAATVLSPEKLCYLYYFDRSTDVDLLIHKISAVLNYLNKRRIQCKVTFTAACQRDVEEGRRKELKKALEQQKNSDSDRTHAALTEYELFDCEDGSDASEEFFLRLGQWRPDLYDGSTRLFPAALDNAAWIGRLTGDGVPYFEFDWKRKTFTKHISCDYLQFIKDNSHIRISDMFSLMNAADTRMRFPEFAEDYETLWGIYTGNYLPANQFEEGVGNWNRLCDALEAYEESREPLALLPLGTSRSGVKKKLRYFLPEYTFQTVKDILAKLIAFGAVEDSSELVCYTNETCRLELLVDASLAEPLGRLFSQPQLLLGYYGIEVTKRRNYNEEYVEIRCSSPDVTGVNLDPDRRGMQDYSYLVLQKLQEAGYISRLTRDPQNPKLASFTYVFQGIKRLLTSAGEILEVYIYDQVLKTGYFDDVACGYEFRWEDGGVKNELDLILTKGFRSMIVECKAVQKLEAAYYYKLDSIAEHFGIGTVKVLVGNTYRHGDENVNDVNRIQRSRGAQLNIKTISAQSKIENIGVVLVELMKEA
ncbi:MAG: DUF1887 family CARF protein [Lachnospiraceae bacterium]|nr:DUF1887 family CARF protein [Lachnospiraceae bacterium]